MSTYTVIQTGNQIGVLCDGTTIDLNPMLSLVDPLYGFGENSDSSMNLAYAILCHCCNEAVAQLLCRDFAGEFLLEKSTAPFEINSDSIVAFAERIVRAQHDAQQAVRNIKPIGGPNRDSPADL